MIKILLIIPGEFYCLVQNHHHRPMARNRRRKEQSPPAVGGQPAATGWRRLGRKRRRKRAAGEGWRWEADTPGTWSLAATYKRQTTTEKVFSLRWSFRRRLLLIKRSRDQEREREIMSESRMFSQCWPDVMKPGWLNCPSSCNRGLSTKR